MIQSESSFDPHTAEDGRRPRANTTTIGWRLPVELVEQVRAQAKREGLREGALVARTLARYLGAGPHIYTAAELEARIKFPDDLFHRKWG